MRAKVKEAAQSSGRKAKFSQMSTFDKTFTVCGDILLFLFVLCIIVPMVYIVIASFMDPVTLQNKGVTFDLSKWTITAYKRVIENKMIWVGFINSIVYSVVFTAISVIVTLMAAYPMSREDFRGRKFFNVIFIITMFFGGGLIPTYLLISRLGMLDTKRYCLLLQNHDAGLQACHHGAGALAVRRNVEQLLRRDDLFKLGIQTAASAGAQSNPDSVPAAARHGIGYSEHGSESTACGTAQIRDDHYLQYPASDYVSVLPEVF